MGLFAVLLPLQILFRLLAEHVGHIAAEDHVDLTAHGEVGGVAVGGHDDHHVMAVGGDVQVYGRAHQLADIHLAPDAIGAQHDMVGADTQHHVLLRYILGGEAGLLVLGQLHGDAVQRHGVLAVLLDEPRIEQVHLGRTDKAGIFNIANAKAAPAKYNNQGVAPPSIKGLITAAIAFACGATNAFSPTKP